MKRLRVFLNTLLGHVTVPLVVITLICCLLVIVINQRAYQTQKEEMITLVRTNLESAYNVQDAQLDVMSAFYQSMFINNLNYQQLRKPVSEKAYYLAATQTLQDLDDVFFSFSGLTCTYYYTADRDYLIQSSTHPNYEQSELIKAYIKSSHNKSEESVYTQSSWHLAVIGDAVYLINVIRQTSSEIGIILDIRNMLGNMHVLDEFEQGALYLTDADGRLVSGIAAADGLYTDCTQDYLDSRSWLKVNCPYAKVPYTLNLILPGELFLEPLYRQNVLITGVLLTALFAMLLAAIHVFYHFTVKPVEDIAKLTKELESGEIGQRLPENNLVTEIHAINHNFNQMVNAITTLKIDLYEEKLRHQEAELAQLRLQLNPHLLLNSLNMIYTMTRQQHYNVSMKFTMCLIRHFRYILKKSHNFVTLTEELDFCENYMEILSLQYPSYFSYEISLSEERIKEETLLPPLSVENLIENAVKYGLTQDAPLHIQICIEAIRRAGLQCTKIVISDNGPGYSDEALSYIHRLLSGEDIKNLASDGVGLKNLIERMRILYEGEASLTFENDSGAKITMTFPSVWPQLTEERTAGTGVAAESAKAPEMAGEL